MENFTYGLDVATALSVIAAAGAFIWNSIVSSRKERKERHKEIVKSYVFQVADKLYDEQIKLNSEINGIRNLLMEGKTTQDLNPFKELVQNIPFTFRSRITPLDSTYGDGRFTKLALEFEKEMDQVILTIAEVTGPNHQGSWDFEDVMTKPIRITEIYISSMFTDAEKFIEEL